MNKKIINHLDDVVSELVEGFIAVNSNYYEKVPDVNGLIYKKHRKGKVAMVIGGGSGHEPLFAGFVGRGLGDAAACGNIFASPDPGTIYETAKAVAGPEGILFLYGNYAGDNLNFDMAEEMLQDEGYRTAHVRVMDDCVSAPPERREDRRGIAGDVFMMKIAGAACDAGLSLEEVVQVCEKASANLSSIGLATSPGQIPGAEKPTFELAEDEIEFGMGIHGEPGIRRAKMGLADDLVDEMYACIMADLPLHAGDKVCVLMNGLGSTTVMELSICYRRLKKLLEDAGVVVYDSEATSYCMSMEMGGFSISILRLDEELKKYYDMPCHSPYYAKESGSDYVTNLE